MLENTKLTVLPNGCKIVTAPMRDVESVSICFDSGIGSRYESTANAGYSHFLEHMLFKGTTARPSTKAVSEPIERTGGMINAFTSLEHTCFLARVSFDATKLAVDVIGDIYSDPIFPAKDLERERNVVFEELKMYHDDDESYVNELSGLGLFPDHPLGRPTIGNVKSLSAADREALLAFHHKNYTSGGTIVAAAGKVDHDKFVEWVRPYIDKISKGRAPKYVPASKASAIKPLMFERRETEQVQALLAFRSISYSDEAYSAQSLLNQILGSGLTSRLFMSVREKAGLAYSVSSSCGAFPDAGYFQVYAGLNTDKSVRGVAMCAKELRKIVKASVTKAELDRAKSAIIGGLRISGETSGSQMFWLVSKYRSLGRMETPEEVVDRINRVTREDIQAFAARIFRPDNMTLAIVMPKNKGAEPQAHLDAIEL